MLKSATELVTFTPKSYIVPRVLFANNVKLHDECHVESGVSIQEGAHALRRAQQRHASPRSIRVVSTLLGTCSLMFIIIFHLDFNDDHLLSFILIVIIDLA